MTNLPLSALSKSSCVVSEYCGSSGLSIFLKLTNYWILSLFELKFAVKILLNYSVVFFTSFLTADPFFFLAPKLIKNNKNPNAIKIPEIVL